MIEQVKPILRKFLLAAAILAAFSGFTILADTQLPEIPEVNQPEANKQTDEKPIVRCPNKSFLLRTPCKTVKPAAPKTKADEQKTLSAKGKVNGNKN